ncbi:MFS transporter [Paenibacillus sp. YYML68]|uniref:MFS transporter n=1 Tax=Paenibacillus sp. YYML68 TaxID=2909250 RepID=UPI002493846E|nr:MFS transporter [Paenibacillus sp. YYML68]
MQSKAFLLAMLSLVFNSVGSSVFQLAEAWYIVNYLGLGQSLGIVLMMTAIPRLVLMPLGGVLADRIPKPQLMFMSDILRALLLLVMLICLISDVLSFSWMLVFALLFGTLDAFYWPAASSLIPAIVPEHQLAQANSYFQIIQQGFYLIGPLIGGLMLTWGSYSSLFSTISIILIIGAFLSLLVGKFMPRISEDEAGSRESLLKEWQGGFTYIRTEPYIKVLMLTLMMAGFFLSGPLAVAIPLLVDSVLKGNALTLSYLEISISVGMIAGGAIIAFTRIRQRRMLISLSCLAACGLCVLGLGITSQFFSILSLLLICGLVLSFSNTYFITLLQERTPPDKLGRVMSLVTTATTGLLPLSHATISLLMNGGASIATILVVFGGMIAIFCTVLIAASRAVRTL